jgi:hypothetical protein
MLLQYGYSPDTAENLVTNHIIVDDTSDKR